MSLKRSGTSGLYSLEQDLLRGHTLRGLRARKLTIAEGVAGAGEVDERGRNLDSLNERLQRIRRRAATLQVIERAACGRHRSLPVQCCTLCDLTMYFLRV